MTCMWQQTCPSLPLQRSLEEITEWIDSEQSIPLNGGTSSTGVFPSGWSAVYGEQDPAVEKNKSSYKLNGMNDSNGFSHLPSCVSVERRLEYTTPSGFKSSPSFVPIAPAPPAGQLDQPMKEDSSRAARFDEFLQVTDLSGTTANKGRRMTPRERDIMLYKRKLRNRDSASRSRKKKKAVIQGLNEELEALVGFYKSKEEETNSSLCKAEKKKLELLEERRCLVKELESLGTELRSAKEQLKSVNRCMLSKEEIVSSVPMNNDALQGRNMRHATLSRIAESEEKSKSFCPTSSHLIRS